VRACLITLATAALTGCAAYNVASTGNTAATLSATEFPAALPATTLTQPAGMPQFVLPVTGGAMILALPLGGNLFLPLDGSPPVAAMAISP